MKSESTAELVEEICDLAEGPARPVLEEAAQEWLKSHKRAIAKSRLEGDFPRSLLDLKWYQQLSKLHSIPSVPWPLTEGDLVLDLWKGLVALTVVHDQNCKFCFRLFPAPKGEDDQVGHALWQLLHDKVREEPNLPSVRKILDYVRSGLQNRGVELPAVVEKAKPAGGGDVTLPDEHDVAGSGDDAVVETVPQEVAEGKPAALDDGNGKGSRKMETPSESVAIAEHVVAQLKPLLANGKKKAKPKKRKPSPETETKRKEREERRAREQAIHDEWNRGEWENYRDYVRWKNENLPDGWPGINRRTVKLAIDAVKKRKQDNKK